MEGVVVEEKRRYPRAPVGTTVSLFRGDKPLGRYLAINVSTGGALLRGAPPAATGEPLKVEIRLLTGGRACLEAVVLRESRVRGKSAFALVFTSLSPGDRQAIKIMVQATLEESRAASVLIVSDDEQGYRTLRPRIQQLGLFCLTVTTPSAAMHCLEMPNRLTRAVVDLSLGADDGRDMLAYLAEHHPDVRRILTYRRPESGEALRECKALGLPHACLALPCGDDAVAFALER